MTRTCIGVVLLFWVTATGWAQPAPSLAAIWTYPGECVSGQHVQLLVTPQESRGADFLPFECMIDTDRNYSEAVLQLNVFDGKETLISETAMPLKLNIGQSKYTVEWDATAAPLGLYRADITIRPDEIETVSRYTAAVKKVTEQQLLEDLEGTLQRLQELRGKLTSGEASGTKPSHMEVRLRTAEDFVQRARNHADAKQWREMDEILNYLEKTSGAVHAWIVFGNEAEEFDTPVADLDMSSLECRNGVVYSSGQPVFLFGRVLPDSAPEAIGALKRYGLNFAVCSLPPRATLADRDLAMEFKSVFNPLFEEAAQDNIAVAVQLAPQEIGAWALQLWPDASAKGFIDITHPGIREAYQRHLNAVLPYLAGQKTVSMVSLAEKPQFRYDSEEVRKAFVAHIQKKYPDRQNLNQLWHAHFAKYDEITIWDATAKDYQYQNLRAYQFDWQSFQRELIREYFTALADAAHSAAPRLWKQAAIADTIFQNGETRQGVDREALAHLMDCSGCAASMQAPEKMYALDYPGQSAVYALLKSFQPEKPVFNLEDQIDFNGIENPEAYLTTALWEGVMSGLNGMALAADSQVARRPETMEAYANACLQINRLAPVVAAFQQTPADVAVLYSDSSKILDDGVPYLKSARFAYEGASFAGYALRFITERQLARGEWADVKVIIIPETPALTDAAFAAIEQYVEKGGAVIRVGTPIPYNEQGLSRRTVLRNNDRTVLVRGLNLPTEYLHGMDGVISKGALPNIPRVVNNSGYPIEGVKSLYWDYQGDSYLYLVNVRKDSVTCRLKGAAQSGRDLILGREVRFPLYAKPLDPMLIRLDKAKEQLAQTTAPDPHPHRLTMAKIKKFMQEWSIPQ